MRRILTMATVLVAFSTSCSKNDSGNSTTTQFTFPSNSIMVKDSIDVNISATSGNFTLYSFKDTSEISNSDSASNRWDFAMRSTIILVNSLNSGPGSATAQLFDGIYNNLTSIPVTGYRADTSATNRVFISDLNNPNSWFDYSSTTRAVSAKAGKVFLFKTANNNKYVKMEMLNIIPVDNAGNVVSPPTRPTKYRYVFRYTLQP